MKGTGQVVTKSRLEQMGFKMLSESI